MWGHLIKLLSLSKGALVIGVAASAAMVSNAEISNTPSHHNEEPSATPIVSIVPSPKTESSTKPTDKPKSVEQPKSTEPSKPDVSGGVKECLAKDTAKDPTALETCKKAMAASGLSGDAFWDKYGRPTPPSTEAKPSTAPKSSTSEETYKLIALCFKLHSAISATSEKSTIDAAYEACNKAIAASGMSTADFWAKFHPAN